MKENITNKSTATQTATQIQSSMFIGNLRAEMDKMSKNCKTNEMVKAAHGYIRTGMSRKETEELLILDGYNIDMAQALMKTANFEEEFAEDTAQKWGFEIQDSHGRIYSSNDDFGIIVTANY